MKAVHLILVSFLSLLLFSSCKKYSDLEIITGKWVSQEESNGFPIGRDLKWISIPAQYQSMLEFTSDGHYIGGNSFINCNGTFSLTDHDLNINTPCGSFSFSYHFGRTPNILVIDYFIRDYAFKVKYIKMN